MHPAARLQFERIVDEFVQWRAIPADDRPLAPSWWWGPALGALAFEVTLPSRLCGKLGLSEGATYAAGAKILLATLAGQTFLPWPYDFSQKVASTDSDVRDLHVQPSDDSAFPP